MMFRYIPGVSIDGPFFQADQGNPPGMYVVALLLYFFMWL